MKLHIKRPNDIKLSSSTLKLHLIPLSWCHFRPRLLLFIWALFFMLSLMDFLSIICQNLQHLSLNVSNPRWIGIEIGIWILLWDGFHTLLGDGFSCWCCCCCCCFCYCWSTFGLATDNLFWLYNSIIIIKTIRIKLVSCAHNSWIFIMWQSGACALYVKNTDDGCHPGAFAIFFLSTLPV